MTAYIDGKVDQVEIFYNGYISPLTQEVRRETLLPLQEADILEAGPEDEDDGSAHHALVALALGGGGRDRRGNRREACGEGRGRAGADARLTGDRSLSPNCEESPMSRECVGKIALVM